MLDALRYVGGGFRCMEGRPRKHWRRVKTLLPKQFLRGDAERPLEASAEMTKVTETVREGRVRDGANFALRERDAARFQSLGPYPTHRRGADRAEEAVEGSDGYSASSGERLRREFRIV